MKLIKSLKLLLLIVPILLSGCSETDTEAGRINTDLSGYGLDTLQLRTLNSSEVDSLANNVNQNIKQDYRLWRSSRNNEDNSDSRDESYFADKIYGFYLSFPESEHRIEDMKRAFAIWAASGLPDKMETVLNEISVNKSYWPELAAYYQLYQTRFRKKSWIPFADARKLDAYRTQLSAWNSMADNDMTKSHLNFYLAESYFLNKEYQKADEYLSRVLELTRDSVFAGSEFTVKMARSFYNEIHTLQAGDQAPSFSATSITGEPVSLSEYRDKVVLLVFWSTTCVHSHTDIPVLRDMHANLGNREDFVIIGVSPDDDIGTMKSFTEGRDMNWNQINDNEFGQLSVLYSAYYTPRMYLIDKEGKIVNNNLTGRTLKKAVTQLLR